MFKDQEEALRRLEQQLLEEEADEQLLAEEGEEEPSFYQETREDEIDRFFMENTDTYHAYNADTTDTDLEVYAQEVWEGKPNRLSGWVALACILATGILLVFLYLLARYGGLL